MQGFEVRPTHADVHVGWNVATGPDNIDLLVVSRE